MPIDESRLPPELRTYRLARLFGWTTEQIDNTPAHTCDWLLALAAIEDKVRAEAEAKRGGGR